MRMWIAMIVGATPMEFHPDVRSAGGRAIPLELPLCSMTTSPADNTRPKFHPHGGVALGSRLMKFA